jgi:two-component system nitrate/nitrite response regulator NarL
MIRLLIVADIRLYREGLALLLAQRSGFASVNAASPDQTVESARDIQPNVVLLDLAAPGSLGMLRTLNTMAPDVAVIGLAVSDTEQDLVAGMEAGLAGYVSRDGSIDDLVAAIESAARGELRCSPRLAGTLLRRLAALSAKVPSRPELPRLTNREREIAQLLQQNLSNKEIATRLGIEVATAKNHVHNLLEKLNVRRRCDVDVCRVSPLEPMGAGGHDQSH